MKPIFGEMKIKNPQSRGFVTRATASISCCTTHGLQIRASSGKGLYSHFTNIQYAAEF
jgi:hypothetical protein